MEDKQWMDQRLIYLRGLKSPNDQQRLMIVLAEKQNRTADDQRKLAAIVRAEKATERAQKARANAARVINADKAIARKARDHALYQSAGLLILAGLVDSATGQPTRDRGELLGLLVAAKQMPVNPQWKTTGDSLLAK